MLKEKTERIEIEGKEYILKFRKNIFDNSKYVVEILKEKGQYELITVACIELEEEQ
jgi:hypothetical protein